MYHVYIFLHVHLCTAVLHVQLHFLYNDINSITIKKVDAHRLRILNISSWDLQKEGIFFNHGKLTVTLSAL